MQNWYYEIIILSFLHFSFSNLPSWSLKQQKGSAVKEAGEAYFRQGRQTLRGLNTGKKMENSGILKSGGTAGTQTVSRRETWTHGLEK